ncbi:unnamed protein product, partial [Rotaria magnacalcarata]
MKKENTNSKNEFHSNRSFYIPKRIIVALLTSFGLLVSTFIQTNFAITNSLILNPHDSKDILIDDNDQLATKTTKVNWTSVELGYLNSIFYLGYLLAHIPSGFLVHKLSAI